MIGPGILKDINMRFFLMFILLVTLQASAQTPEAYFKQLKDVSANERMGHLRLGGTGTSGGLSTVNASTNFDIKYYRCEWDVNPAIRYISGKITVYYTITTAASSIAFDMMSPLVADSVKQRSSTLTKQFSNNTLTINFPASVNAGTLDSLTIFYQGIPPNTGFGSFYQGTHGAAVPVMWSLSEPYGSRDWWPCKNGLDDKADSLDIFITYPAAYKATSNGILQSETLVASGTKKISWWKHRYPVATYLICFAVTNYTVFNNSVQLGAVNLPVQTYCYPESLTEFQTYTYHALDALKLYSSYFGEYPFIKEKYGHVQFGWGGGMEHQTNSFITNASGGLISHELGHQWFGDKITCASWKDIWLNEGFATHLATFYGENIYPSIIISNRKSEIDYVTSAPGGSVLVDDTTDVNRIFDYRLTYLKGSHLIYMLRWKLGDSVFFKGIRDYQKDPKIAYGYATTADLQRNLEQASGQNLQHFFDQWYKGQGHPTYLVEWTPIDTAYVRIKMNQTTSHPSVPFFEMPVALKFSNASKQRTVVVDNKTNGEIFIKNIGFVPDTVQIDPEYWLLSRNNSSRKVADNVSGQNTVQVYPNPVGDQFYVYLRNFTATSPVINLFNAAGQLIYQKALTSFTGSAFVEIPSRHLPAGSYTVSVRAGGNFKFSKKLLKY